MKYLYRCKCGKRRSLPRLHTDYIRKPKCVCGNLLTYRDVWQEKKNRETVCNCDGAHYPHRAGSILFCVESTTKPTNDDFSHYYGIQPSNIGEV